MQLYSAMNFVKYIPMTRMRRNGRFFSHRNTNRAFISRYKKYNVNFPHAFFANKIEIDPTFYVLRVRFVSYFLFIQLYLVGNKLS